MCPGAITPFEKNEYKCILQHYNYLHELVIKNVTDVKRFSFVYQT